MDVNVVAASAAAKQKQTEDSVLLVGKQTNDDKVELEDENDPGRQRRQRQRRFLRGANRQ